ncbi:hypothetical protein H8A99_05945 [Bradyrhizobium sp. Arg68]|uniref:hypothetical protein n=1 Tax=Bradyrhizobium ivorense TaxID=2511166 RepID=UPI001E4FD657|nr:hypothetical protein [Bradyrhizobium ivorense]MCC8936046.1 hypothetical protein [Bradyrhizobium ivorense]
MIFSLTNDPHDLLLKLALPPIVAFLAGWIIISAWANRQDAEATGFSPAVASAFFTPAIFITYLLFPPQFFTMTSSSAVLTIVLIPTVCGLLFAPTFFPLLPFGIKSLARVQEQMPAFSGGLLFTVFASWLITQAGWLAFLVYALAHAL